MTTVTSLLTNVTKSELTGDAFSAFWQKQMESFTPFNVVMVLACALVSGLVISWIYRKTYRGVLYSPTFCLSLIMLNIITAPVVMAIGSDVALSMGMVGALSIIRFRTAVKEPLDTTYMFWSITMGIMLGAQLFLIGAIVLVCVSAMLLGISYIKFRNPNGYLLVMHYDEYAEPDIEAELRRSVRARRMRSKTLTRAGAEMTVEVRLDHRSDLVGHMLDIEGVHDATLVACQTEAGA